MEPAELLKKYFGYDTFRPMQEDVIKTILSGRDVLAVMPTGAGKSVCFQIPALLFPHGTIIISPLISLMKDQVEALAEQGISASYVNSTVPFDESIERLRDLFRGRLKLLYMAPEKLEPTYFTDWRGGTMQAWKMARGGKGRKIFPSTASMSWWRQTLLAWASTRATCDTSSTTRCPKAWKPTIRKRGGQDVTARKRNASSFTAGRT